MTQPSSTLVIVLFVAFLATLVPHPAEGRVSGSLTWTGSIFRGYDDFYQDFVIAFKAGQLATINFQLYNEYTTPTMILSSMVRMDWGQNYLATDTPFTLQPAQTHSFAITFVVPSTSMVSSLLTYGFQVIVENNQTSPWTSIGYQRFAIFSSDQLDAQNLRQTYITLSQATGSFAALPFPSSNSNARTLIVRAQTESFYAGQAYQAGDFASAKQRYQNAVELTNQALASLQAQGSSFESAVSNYLNLGTIGPILNGVGWIIIGLGVVWFARRNSAPRVAPSTTPRAQAMQTDSR